MVFTSLASKARSIPRATIKFLLIMKLTVLLFLLSFIQASATLNAQKISIREHNVPIKIILKDIEKETGYTFFYDNFELDLSRKISVDVKAGSIGDIIALCFNTQPVTYKIFEKNILLKKEQPLQQTYNIKERVSVTGKVTDEKGTPIAGASVKIKGSNKGVATGADGRFSLETDNDAILEITSVGYENKEVLVSSNTPLNIVLRQSYGVLDQLVVVGYGTQKKKDITGSVSTISSQALDDRPNVEFGYAIEGKAAGVQVIRSSGQPQAGFSIRIRGTSSITSGSDPLYIVDGVPTTSLSDINPADIESFSILKDAASAAIYGASGANGVVLITTKHGKSNRSVVNLEAYTGTSNIWRRPKVLDAKQYENLMDDMGESLDWTQYTANTNWADELFRTGVSQNYQASVSGGDDKTTYYLSGGFVKQNGVVIVNTLNRANVKLNLDHKISKVFKVGTNLSYNRWYDVAITENARNGVIMNSILGSPVIGIWNDNHTQYTSDPYYNDLDNPVGLATGNPPKWTNYRFQGNAYLEANILPELKFKTMFGYEQYHGILNTYEDPYKTTEGRNFKGKAELAQDNTEYWISENTLNYTKTFNKHSLNVLVGFVTSKTNTMSSDAVTENFANPNVTTIDGGSISPALPTGPYTSFSTVSFISRLEYNYAEKYLLTANFRSDASSVFGPDRRWGSFPSFSAGWRISKEKFFENVHTISDLKIRASWGKVGNSQIPAYSYLGLVNTNGAYVIGDKVVPGTNPSTLQNLDLKWETTKQTDIGIDLGMFSNRVLFTVDYYYKKTIGLLLNVPTPASSGYTSSIQNIGDLRNKGFDLELDTKNLNGKFKWNSSLNFSINRNKVLNIAGGTIYDGMIDERDNSSIVQAGLPLGSFYGYVAKGVDPNTGNMIYKMADTSAGLQTSDEEVIGNANPKFTYGFTNEFSYKNWSLTVFFQGVQGNDILDATRIYSEGMWQPRNQSTAVLRRWTTPGQITDIPRPDMNNDDEPQPYYNSLISSRFVENGSYIRLKSLSLAYNLSSAALQRLKIQNIKFYITSENLFTITKYKGLDPEVSAFGASNTAPGIDFGTYPQTRDFVFGLTATF